MKENYEDRSKTYLIRRTPVIIRLDGKAFHTFTKGFQKPFDDILKQTMVATTKYLCENIQGVKFAYQQSDEITLVLTDYDTLETAAWFDYNVQKLCSISASMATFMFNRVFQNLVGVKCELCYVSDQPLGKYETALCRAVERGAMFDARAFSIPKEEVANCVVWRWIDAKRNSVQMVGQAHFSHKELQGKNQTEICQMLADIKQPWFQYDDNNRFGTMLFKGEDGKWVEKPAYPSHESLRNMVNMCINYKEEE